MKTLLSAGMLATALLALTGCPSTGVGDPCVPEVIPADGFQIGEAYLETSSVQCRTRVCMVYQRGAATAINPEQTREQCTASGQSPAVCDTFPTQAERDSRVYCTCRCSAPEGSNTPTCECPTGYTCDEGDGDGLITGGGDGIRGGYCRLLNDAEIAAGAE